MGCCSQSDGRRWKRRMQGEKNDWVQKFHETSHLIIIYEKLTKSWRPSWVGAKRKNCGKGREIDADVPFLSLVEIFVSHEGTKKQSALDFRRLHLCLNFIDELMHVGNKLDCCWSMSTSGWDLDCRINKIISYFWTKFCLSSGKLDSGFQRSIVYSAQWVGSKISSKGISGY